MWCKQTHTYCNASTDTNTGLKPGECYIFYDFARWLFIFTILLKNTHLNTAPWSDMTTCQPHPVCFFIHLLFWPAIRPLASPASQTTLTALLSPSPPSSPLPEPAINPASQAQCGFTYCHNNTSHCPTSTLREWVINKPGAICWLSVKSRTPLRYQSSARHQALLSFLPLL